ncbi:MAG: hypothetical protein ACYDCQ_23000, partial [Dehalococcoidia bacterium]
MAETQSRPEAAEPVAAGDGDQLSIGAMPAPLPRTPLSAGQVRAIFDVMRTFRDDDLSRVAHDATFSCGRCGRTRTLAGSVAYGELRLCNGCATDYELMRTAGIEGDLCATDIPSGSLPAPRPNLPTSNKH